MLRLDGSVESANVCLICSIQSFKIGFLIFTTRRWKKTTILVWIIHRPHIIHHCVLKMDKSDAFWRKINAEVGMAAVGKWDSLELMIIVLLTSPPFESFMFPIHATWEWIEKNTSSKSLKFYAKFLVVQGTWKTSDTFRWHSFRGWKIWRVKKIKIEMQLKQTLNSWRVLMWISAQKGLNSGIFVQPRKLLSGFKWYGNEVSINHTK